MPPSRQDTKRSLKSTSLEFNIPEILRPFANLPLRSLRERYYIGAKTDGFNFPQTVSCDTQSKIVNLKSKIERCFGIEI
jgi:hypothetical protein